jgi:hypothetical protein
MEIDLLPFRTKNSRSFIGRADGKTARAQLMLDTCDKNEEEYTFILPADTTSFNHSFFLGFVRESVETLGVDRYIRKYHFLIKNNDKDIIEALTKNLQDGLRNVVNTMLGASSSVFE